MKRVMAAVLTALLALTGCGSQQPTALAGLEYTAGSMVGHSAFQIRLTRQELESARFWPAGESDGPVELAHVPVTGAQWTELEAVVLALYRDGALTEKPTLPKKQAVDGSDGSALTLLWETAGGVTETQYLWPDDRRVLTLTALLEELADPRGREIPRFDQPELQQLILTRHHWLGRHRDYAFQIGWAAYDPADPHWELICALGEDGAVSRSRLRLEDADWAALLELTAVLQLDSCPDAPSESRLTCSLRYSDGSRREIRLSKDAEQRLKAFFFNLMEQTETDR